MNLKKMTLHINGADRMFICDPEKDTLADVLRRLGLTGMKIGCGYGVCGACSVILNGKVIRSCTRKIDKIEEYSTSVHVGRMRCRTVRLLCTWIHRFCLPAPAGKSKPYKRRSQRLVHQAQKRLQMYRLQADC